MLGSSRGRRSPRTAGSIWCKRNRVLIRDDTGVPTRSSQHDRFVQAIARGPIGAAASSRRMRSCDGRADVSFHRDRRHCQYKKLERQCRPRAVSPCRARILRLRGLHLSHRAPKARTLRAGVRQGAAPRRFCDHRDAARCFRRFRAYPPRRDPLAAPPGRCARYTAQPIAVLDRLSAGRHKVSEDASALKARQTTRRSLARSPGRSPPHIFSRLQNWRTSGRKMWTMTSLASTSTQSQWGRPSTRGVGRPASLHYLITRSAMAPT